jgi:hypothetical protein
MSPIRVVLRGHHHLSAATHLAAPTPRGPRLYASATAGAGVCRVCHPSPGSVPLLLIWWDWLLPSNAAAPPPQPAQGSREDAQVSLGLHVGHCPKEHKHVSGQLPGVAVASSCLFQQGPQSAACTLSNSTADTSTVHGPSHLHTARGAHTTSCSSRYCCSWLTVQVRMLPCCCCCCCCCCLRRRRHRGLRQRLQSSRPTQQQLPEQRLDLLTAAWLARLRCDRRPNVARRRCCCCWWLLPSLLLLRLRLGSCSTRHHNTIMSNALYISKMMCT